MKKLFLWHGRESFTLNKGCQRFFLYVMCAFLFSIYQKGKLFCVLRYANQYFYTVLATKTRLLTLKSNISPLTLFRSGGYQIDTCLPFSLYWLMVFALNRSNLTGIGLKESKTKLNISIFFLVKSSYIFW